MNFRKVFRGCAAAAICLGLIGCVSSEKSKGPARSEAASSAQNRGTRSRSTREEKPNTLGPHAKAPMGRAIQWRVDKSVGVQRVPIWGKAGWCPDIKNSFPKITGVREVDRPHAIILTAYITNNVVPGCAAVEALWNKTVILRQPLRNRALYDGIQSPPEKRWPRDR